MIFALREARLVGCDNKSIHGSGKQCSQHINIATKETLQPKVRNFCCKYLFRILSSNFLLGGKKSANAQIVSKDTKKENGDVRL